MSTQAKSERSARFVTDLVQGESKNVVGIVVPESVIEALGSGKRPPVKVTIKGYAYRSTVAVMGGRYMIGVAAEHRAKAKVAGGDTVEVQLDLDSEVRTVEAPVDLVAALAGANATAAFEAMAFSRRKEHVRSISDAKSSETRQRRIDAAVKSALSLRR
jgi:hypothetical protein